jgi:hypothetical protein
MVGSCEYGDEPSGSTATDLVSIKISSFEKAESHVGLLHKVLCSCSLFL